MRKDIGEIFTSLQKKNWYDKFERKVSKKLQEKHDFYLATNGRFQKDYKMELFNRDKILVDTRVGWTSCQCFREHENGSVLWCKEPGKLFQVLNGKALINWHIDQWSDGVAEWLLFMWELEGDKTLSWIPQWVWEAVVKFARKKRSYEGL